MSPAQTNSANEVLCREDEYNSVESGRDGGDSIDSHKNSPSNH